MSTGLVELSPAELAELEQLVTEDGKPVDNRYVEKQQRLLTETLYSSWNSPDNRAFWALANVGLFYQLSEPPLVPDVMLSLDVGPVPDARARQSRSYFSWIIGKIPEIVIEIVSDRRGGEDTEKMQMYANWKLAYYVIYDPDQHLGDELVRAYALEGGRYRPLKEWYFSGVGLGLMLWSGDYEGQPAEWLRWCDAKGELILTGRERAELEHDRAEQERERAEQERERADLERLRAGKFQTQMIQEQERADQLRVQMEQEQQRAAQERVAAEQKLLRMAERLRELGIDVE